MPRIRSFFSWIKLIKDSKLHFIESMLQIQVRQLLEGGNYSREETINFLKVFTAETIQGRKLFEGGNYSRKYGTLKCFVTTKFMLLLILLISYSHPTCILRPSFWLISASFSFDFARFHNILTFMVPNSPMQ